jgi:cytochrome c oxidase subunit II
MKFLLQLVTALLALGLLSYAFLSLLGGGSADVDPATLSPSEQALRLAQSRGCLACHSIDGRKGIGPTWLGAWGQTRLLKDGTSVVVDESYLRLAMVNPAAQMVEGYDPVMLPAGFTEQELQLVVDYIRELGESAE